MSLWYLVQFKPNSHNLAQRNLARQGFETFLPLEKITKKHASRFKNVLTPLFPGYLFVEFDLDSAPWRQINGTLGVTRLVNLNGKPDPLPSALIEGLQQRCDSDGVLLREVDLRIGDKVRINSGPFSSVVAKIESLAPNDRSWVLLDFMGLETRVSVKNSQLTSKHL